METRNGKDVITFSIGSAPNVFSAGSGTPASYPKKKTPSQCRRDHRKKEEFLAKKNLKGKETSLKKHPAISSDLAKVTLTEPKDEINLEQPDVNEATVETEVNYVGEYVYDTKLDKGEIHKEFWKKLKENFKSGVDEFSDGSTCNELVG